MYLLEIARTADEFRSRLSLEGIAQLHACWQLLQRDPHPDGRAKLRLERLPAVIYVHICHGFYSAYAIRRRNGDDVITVYACGWEDDRARGFYDERPGRGDPRRGSRGS